MACAALLVSAWPVRASAQRAVPAGAPPPAAPNAAAGSQPAGSDTATRIVAGRIVRPGREGMDAVPGVWVYLHRIGADTAGALDSMRAGAGGRYAFRYRHTGDPDAIYLVSADYNGMAYFSAPLTRPRITGDDGEITVYDTTSAAVPLHVRGRHLVIAAPRIDGSRDVLEVYELSNDSSVTRVSPDGTTPTWSATLPDGAQDVAPGQMDLAPQTFRIERGQVVTVSPFAPGVRQLSYSYRLGASAFPLSLPIANGTDVVEVLTEEPRAEVQGAGLTAMPAVQVSGRTFERHLSQHVPPNSVVRVVAPHLRGTGPGTRALSALAAAMLAVMLGALFFALRRRARTRGALRTIEGGAPLDPERLARAIARIEERMATSRDAGERATLSTERDALRSRLVAALATRPGAG
ncbi:MAG TPA: hypothetical protein VFK13_00450 [Gemmatimonadaceae bacterium]|nr:hypothetical protein [Gemmatimonadaceae bacterium]